MNKVIRNKKEYREAVARLDELFELNPSPESPEDEEIGVLSVLIDDYESREYAIAAPDPVEAITFRMEQQDLTQRDLIPFIGSRSKVSEVLSKKRTLTLPMIRALHHKLGIPASVLLIDRDPTELEESEIEWKRFPITEILRRGWIDKTYRRIADHAEEICRDFFDQLTDDVSPVLLYRRTENIRSGREMDKYALTAWTARIIIRAKEEPTPNRYVTGSVTTEFMQTIAKLSTKENGPQLARERLREIGIALVVEPQLPKTYLDGAAIGAFADCPIIALTLRYDRLDNFWFCLMHELVHVSLHIDGDAQFFDNLDSEDNISEKEREADRVAGEVLIPNEAWIASPASKLRTKEAAAYLADELGINVAIVAGRMRHEFKSYRILNNLVGHGEVRKQFPEIRWAKK